MHHKLFPYLMCYKSTVFECR